mmetsp:Transcript_58157/g.166814  ORF Transcript_58157/g.166814 Transcript_58157/m.166814 type:complete len:227 (-) Transcript_58157:227-907(-)
MIRHKLWVAQGCHFSTFPGQPENAPCRPNHADHVQERRRTEPPLEAERTDATCGGHRRATEYREGDGHKLVEQTVHHAEVFRRERHPQGCGRESQDTTIADALCPQCERQEAPLVPFEQHETQLEDCKPSGAAELPAEAPPPRREDVREAAEDETAQGAGDAEAEGQSGAVRDGQGQPLCASGPHAQQRERVGDGHQEQRCQPWHLRVQHGGADPCEQAIVLVPFL